MSLALVRFYPRTAAQPYRWQSWAEHDGYVYMSIDRDTDNAWWNFGTWRIERDSVGERW
jgi:hypothetical protein